MERSEHGEVLSEATGPGDERASISPSPSATPSATSSVTTESSWTSSAHDSSLARNFARLPAELRLKIWRCAAEPRILIFDDLFRKPAAYPLPSVTQVSRETRRESRRGYECVGPGRSSYVNFNKDIVVCDSRITEAISNEPLEALATRVERLAFWDCYPDDTRIERPYFYSTYLAACQAAASAAMIAAGSIHTPAGAAPSPSSPRLPAVDFDKLWFPNLRDLWIVKVGGVSSTWLIDTDLEEDSYACEAASPAGFPGSGTSHETFAQLAQSRRTARKFRYWVKDNVVEMAVLSLDDPDTRLVLHEGRCYRPDCKEINRGRPLLISKVTFMDGPYQPSEGWMRILLWDENSTGPGSGSTAGQHSSGADTGTKTKNSPRDSMRWIVVERTLTFSLRWESSNEVGQESRRQIGSQGQA